MTEHEFLHLKELNVTRTYTSLLPGAQSQTPVKFVLKSEFLLGNWANAVEASINLGTAGAVAGLAATFSGDMILPNQTFPSGAYYCAHFSFGPQASSAWNTLLNPVAFMRLENWGTKTEFDDKAFLMHIEGLTEGTGHLFSVGASAPAVAATLKINIGGTAYYLMLASAEAT